MFPKILVSKALDVAVVVKGPGEEQALPAWMGFRQVREYVPLRNYPIRFYDADRGSERMIHSHAEECSLPYGWLPAGKPL